MTLEFQNRHLFIIIKELTKNWFAHIKGLMDVDNSVVIAEVGAEGGRGHKGIKW